MKLTLIASLVALAAAVATFGPGKAGNAMASRADTIALVDLTDDFDRAWTAANELPEAERAEHVQARFRDILPGFYDAGRMAAFGISPEKYAERLKRKIAEYPQQREGIARVSSEFSQLLAPAIRSFETELGPLRDYPPIYLLHSMGEFDGAVRDLPEGTRLLFGADVIDRIHKNAPIQPFFHHELFHLYHARRFGACKPLWCSLWTEGLAVYAAARLNPGASDAALLLEFPEPIRPKVDARRETAVCTVRKLAHSTRPEDYVALFTGSGAPPDGLPARSAYYVGYLVASDLGKGRTLKKLAALTIDEAQPLIDASLARMASCPELSAKAREFGRSAGTGA